MTKGQLADIFDEALAQVDDDARKEYSQNAPQLINFVDRAMETRTDIESLLGGQSFQLLRDNHVNHAKFMGSVLALKSGLSLVETIVWVYSAYPGRGVSLEYFPLALQAWREAVGLFLSPTASPSISKVYSGMIEYHPILVELARNREEGVYWDDKYDALIREYLDCLLEPNMKKSVDLASRHISGAHDVGEWWVNVVEPSMRKIGALWEEGRISVGQEHLATSITQRVMSVFYSKILDIPRPKGVVALAATPGELHEIGARMVADLLEIDGWDVHFTGANTPVESLITLLQTHKVRFLLLSTTLVSHLDQVIELIRLVRSANLDPTPKILVGGQAYAPDPGLWRTVYADAIAGTAQSAKTVLDDWAEN